MLFASLDASIVICRKSFAQDTDGFYSWEKCAESIAAWFMQSFGQFWCFGSLGIQDSKLSVKATAVPKIYPNFFAKPSAKPQALAEGTFLWGGAQSGTIGWPSYPGCGLTAMFS